MYLSRLVAFAILASAPAWGRACWNDAAQRYGVSADLLYAIARVESNLNPRVVNRSHFQRTGSYDIGLMQINSGHLRRLAHYGISEADLLEPCTNLHVGAWLLADVITRHGATWNAVGAYNATCSQLKEQACSKARSKYAWLVFRQLPTPHDGAQPEQAARPNAGSEAIAAPMLLSVRVSP